MKLVASKIAKTLVLSMYMLGMAVVAVGAVHNHTSVHHADSFVALEKDEAEKNITGVKVMYNPIAEQINVNFKLSKESTVVIKLMDALGNEVLSLANSAYEEGSQSLSFETEGKVSAGFYFVKLTSGTETVIKRISIR